MGKGKGKGNEGISRCGRRPLDSRGEGRGKDSGRDCWLKDGMARFGRTREGLLPMSVFKQRLLVWIFGR